MKTTHPILLFDGVCNLCDGFVQFVIKHDSDAKFRFAALQSEAGQALLSKKEMDTASISTVVLVIEDQVYTHSDVALEVAHLLGGGWRLLTVFRFLPKGFRDRIYNWVAKNRYRWFGEKDACMIPTPELKERFL